MVVAEVLLSLVAIALLYILWSRRRMYMCAFKMKGPWGFPFVGIAHKLYKMEDVLYVMPQYTKEYKQKTYFTWLGPFPIIYTIDPNIAEIVLQSPDCLNKGIAYKAIDHAVGDGLLTSKPPKWTKHRKLLSPCFGYKVLLDLMPTFNKFARDLCGEMDRHVGCGEADIKHLALRMGLRAAFAITMGIDDIKEESSAQILKSFEDLLEIVINRTLQPWLTNSTIYSWTSSYKTFLEARSCISDSIQDLIRNKLDILKKKDPEAVSGEKVSHVFIDQAIRVHLQNEFTIEDILDEAKIMVIAAYETTANTLYSTLMFLAMHPEFQERAFDEISTLYHEKEFDVPYDDLKRLVYLDMCINETLRLSPSIPMIGRVCGKDLRISEDITIPAGGEIYIDIFNIHRDEDIWGPTANTYNPDHFLPSNLQGKHKNAFMPFSKGKRNCMGWQYAGMFLKVMLAQIIRKYKFFTTFRYEDLRFMEYISMRYVTTPLLEVQRR